MVDLVSLFKDPNNFLIIGKKGSGKTCLGWNILERCGFFGRKLYVFKFPNVDLLGSLPFEVENLVSFKQVFNLKNGVCIIDEAHKYFDVLNKSINVELRDLLACSRQNNMSFIFITHNSYFINRGLFSYIDVRIIKEVNEAHWDCERLHMKKLYERSNVVGVDSFFIDSDIFKGKERFNKPAWFNDAFSNVYANVNYDISFFDKICEKNADECESYKIK